MFIHTIILATIPTDIHGSKTTGKMDITHFCEQTDYLTYNMSFYQPQNPMDDFWHKSPGQDNWQMDIIATSISMADPENEQTDYLTYNGGALI